jgi:hypothetical protein
MVLKETLLVVSLSVLTGPWLTQDWGKNPPNMSLGRRTAFADFVILALLIRPPQYYFSQLIEICQFVPL